MGFEAWTIEKGKPFRPLFLRTQKPTWIKEFFEIKGLIEKLEERITEKHLKSEFTGVHNTTMQEQLARFCFQLK